MVSINFNELTNQLVQHTESFIETLKKIDKIKQEMIKENAKKERKSKSTLHKLGIDLRNANIYKETLRKNLRETYGKALDFFELVEKVRQKRITEQEFEKTLDKMSPIEKNKIASGLTKIYSNKLRTEKKQSNQLFFTYLQNLKANIPEIINILTSGKGKKPTEFVKKLEEESKTRKFVTKTVQEIQKIQHQIRTGEFDPTTITKTIDSLNKKLEKEWKLLFL